VNQIKKIFEFIGFEIHRTGTSGTQSYEFLKQQIYTTSRGILHIGAHLGQEAATYALHGSRVLWIEAIPEIYEVLEKRIVRFPAQRAINALVGDEQKIVDFFITTNHGQSSSIFELASDNGFSVGMHKKIKLEMKRLDSILKPNDAYEHDHWVIDVQGAELSVLKGSGYLLNLCQSIDVEISTYETYINGTKYDELDRFLRSKGFVPLWRVGHHFHGNVLYLRVRGIDAMEKNGHCLQLITIGAASSRSRRVF
jgi:FkbM family methyltransferase